MLQFRLRILATLMCVLALSFLNAQSIDPNTNTDSSLETEKSFENFYVRDKSISDILLTFSDLYNRSIVYDESVRGQASYYFATMDFDVAFRTFLTQNNLFLSVQDDVYYVSRIAIENADANAYTLRASEVDVNFLLDTLAAKTNSTILYDALPELAVSIYVENTSIKKILNIVQTRLGVEYVLENGDEFFYVKSVRANEEYDTSDDWSISKDSVGGEETYSISLYEGQLDEVIRDLFNKGAREYNSYISLERVILRNVFFKNKKFDTLVQLLLSQNNGAFEVHQGIYYFFEMSNEEFVKSLKEIKPIVLEHISPQDFLDAVPKAFLMNNIYEINDKNNSILVMGSQKELENFQRVADSLDKPKTSVRKRIDLKHLQPSEALQLLKEQFPEVKTQELPRFNSIVVDAMPNAFPRIEAYIALVDKGQFMQSITLRYTRAEELLKNLPSSLSESEFVKTNDPRTVVFLGSPEKFELVNAKIKVLDRPSYQLKYQILVLQHTKDFNFFFGLTGSNNFTKPDDQTGVVGEITNTLTKVSFDILSTFGYTFAAKLNTSLSSGNSQIFIDTVLRGLSGQKVSFASDDIYRYQESEVSENNKLVAKRGVTREITTGFTIDISGWISGDDTVTMEIETSLSKIGVASASSNAPPATNKRTLKTNVKTKVGRPITIGGLYQSEKSNRGKNYFLDYSNKKTKAEYVVYIIPVVERTLERKKPNSLSRLYTHFVKENAQ